MYMSRFCAALFALLRLEYGFLRSHIRHRCQAVNSSTTVSYVKSFSFTSEHLAAEPLQSRRGLTFGHIYSSAWVTFGPEFLLRSLIPPGQSRRNSGKSMEIQEPADLALAIEGVRS
jgi:hypothetical protein